MYGNLIPIVLGLAVAMAFFAWFESWISHDMAYKLLAEMRIALYRKLDPLAPAYLLSRRSGDLASIVTSDVETIESFFAHAIAPLFVAVLVPGFAITALAFFCWPLALVLLPFLVAVTLSPSYIGRHTERLGNELRQAAGGGQRPRHGQRAGAAGGGRLLPGAPSAWTRSWQRAGP